MSIDSNSIYSRRVSQGTLQYEEQIYAYAFAEDLTELGDILDTPKVTSQDFSNVSFGTDKTILTSGKWCCHAGDNVLSIYFAAVAKENLTVSPDMYRVASRAFVFQEKCLQSCPQDESYLRGILYRRTIAAALSDLKQHKIRVLSGSTDQSQRLFTVGALSKLRADQEGAG